MSFGEVCAALSDNDKAKGYVSKKAESGGRWAFCFGFLPNDHSESELLELIAAEYGPGEYPVQFKTPNDSGREQIRWQRNWHVQARRLSAQSLPATPAPTATPPPATDALAAALESQTQMLSAVLEKLSTPAPVPEQKSTLEIAGELAALKDLFTDSKQSVLEQVKDVLELKQMLLDNNDAPADPMAAALKYLGPAIEKGLEAQTQILPARPGPIVAGRELSADEIQKNIDQVNADNAAAGPTPPPLPPMPADPTEDDISKAFDVFAESYLSAILQLSETDQPPVQVAEWVVRMIGNADQALYVIGLVICQDDMVKRLTKYDDRVLNCAAWLDSVADHLAHALWPETNAAPKADSATISATIESSDGEGVITGADQPGDSEDELVAGGGVPDERKDVPTTGHDNDA
jgi:hypothetical protein